MRYTARQAWRAQWVALLLILVLALMAIAAASGVPAAYGRPELTIIAAILCLASIVGLIIVVYRHYQWKFTIDEVNIESSRGIIGRHISSIRIKDLRNVNLRQSLMQRLLNIGDLEFSSAGGKDIEVRFHDIVDPVATKRYVQRASDQIGDRSADNSLPK